MISAVSTRITKAKNYYEIRDTISHDLINNLHNQNIIPLLISNSGIEPEKYFYNIKFDLLILSGGDDLILKTKTSDKNLEKQKRDKTEKKLIEFCIKKNIPIIGICRGMQLINSFFGGSQTLDKKNIHIDQNHKISVDLQGNKIFLNNNFFVNSFHKFVIEQEKCGQELIPIMFAKDKTIEAFIHKKFQILGVMFHPERKFPDDSINFYFNNNFYKRVLDFFKERK